MSVKEIAVPDIGDFSDVDVIEVLVAVGDTIAVDDPLLTLETDKASMEVPSSDAGVVKELKVSVGDKVSQGSIVLVIEAEGAAEAAAPAAAPAEAAAPAASGGSEDVKVPDIGDFSGVDVIEILVAVGDTIAVDDPLVTLETDKASMEVPSSSAGVVTELKINVGDKVSQGDVILTIAGSGGAAAPAAEAAPAAAPASSAAPAAAAPQATPSAVTLGGVIYASPAVRKLARTSGIDLTQVPASGRKGRITKEDVESFIKGGAKPAAAKAAGGAAAAPAGSMGIEPIPVQDYSKFGEVEEFEMPRIKKISGAHLHRVWVNVPHVTFHDEIDTTEIEAFRQSIKKDAEKAGVKVTPLIFMMQALAKTLQAFPNFNSSLSADPGVLIRKKYYNIGIAVDTPGGLVVPVVKDVDKKGVFELAAELAEISVKARDGKLKPADMSGGCMTISSLGGIGGRAFTPIVNAPEVAILGVTRSYQAPVWNGSEFVPRLMLPVDLSFDHRVIDGAEAAKFVSFFGSIMSDFRRLAL